LIRKENEEQTKLYKRERAAATWTGSARGCVLEYIKTQLIIIIL